jgi:probable HAF family extracellular repeat protein
MFLSVLLAYLNRLSPSRNKHRPRPAASTRRRSAATRPTLEVLEDRVALSGYTFTNIDVPNARFTEADGINARGQIVGNYGDASGQHGFLLSGGQYTTLDDPNAVTQPGLGTFAFGINARGQIVGQYFDANFARHGFLLSGGQYTTLDVPNAGTQPFAGTLSRTAKFFSQRIPARQRQIGLSV